MRRIIAMLAVMALMMVAAVASGAAAAPQNKDYGALWTSESLRDAYVGFATNKSTAIGHAHDRCLRAGNTNPEYKNDCARGVWVHNGWIAWASARDGSWGTGWGPTKQDAAYWAKKTCRKKAHGGNCKASLEAHKTRAFDPNKPTTGGKIPRGRSAM
jgi:hypothetical protein